MPRPSVPVPEIPTTKSPVAGYEDRTCGEATWHMQVEVRSPYGGTDQYVEVLPAILEYEANSVDLDEAIVAFENGLSEISGAISGAQEILDRYKQDGAIDGENYSTIKGIISRAAQYLTSARNLRTYWEDEYRTESGGVNWPLKNRYAAGCEGKVAPARAEGFGFGGGGGAEKVKWLCPTTEVTNQHANDRQKFRDLAYAAMVNARCAQEAAAAVGVHGKNRLAKEGRPTVGGAFTSRKKVTRAFVVKTEPFGGEPEPEESEPEVVEESTPRRKKDNTMVIVGAAALGLLVFSKK